ncbi:MAG: hypothetical protein DRG25_03215, partial [Deltaproteobacteria bacterium]
SQVDAYGNSFTFDYAPDDTNTVTTMEDPLGNSREHVNDRAKLVSSKDEAGNEITLGYDGSGRRNSVTDQLGNNIAYSFHILKAERLNPSPFRMEMPLLVATLLEITVPE